MKRRRISVGDFLFSRGTGLFALILVVLVASIGAVLSYQSMPTIREFGLNFWRTQIWNPVSGEFGALPFIWGTLYSSLIAILIAAPISIGVAVFISELCPNWLKQPLVFLTELLATVPSIVYGLWGVFVLVPAVRAVQMWFPDWLRAVPLFSGPRNGLSMLSAALILTIMVIPFTSSVAREVLKAVPVAQRETAYALGATQWEVTKVALHYARVGIVGSIMLGLGRAFGETMAVTMVIGNNPTMSLSLFAPQYTMASVIANEMLEAANQLHISALIEIGLVLFVVTFVINAGSRLLIWGMTHQKKQVPSAPAKSMETAA